MSWEYFVLGVIFYQIMKLLALAIHNAVVERRQKRFLRAVKVYFPGSTKAAFLALEASDKRTMDKLECQVLEWLAVQLKTNLNHRRGEVTLTAISSREKHAI